MEKIDSLRDFVAELRRTRPDDVVLENYQRGKTGVPTIVTLQPTRPEDCGVENSVGDAPPHHPV